MPRFRFPLLATLAFALSGCGDGSGPGGGPLLDCEDAEPTALSPGQIALVDASETACVRLTGAGATEATYLYLAYSAAGEETTEGTSADYSLSVTADPPTAAAARQPEAGHAEVRASRAQRFHARLRAVGRELARSRPASVSGGRVAPRVSQPPPVVGETRSFNVLRGADVSGTEPDDYVQIESTARYVGTNVAIFLDDAEPSDGGYTQDDLASIGGMFDDHLRPIALDAFGDETDVNGDGMVLVLLSSHVTGLAGCGLGQVVVGLFFAVDLFPDLVGSNDAEIFYGLAPDPACGVSRERALEVLPGVFIHEFQHMINYGQKVIIRDGDAEDTWLDEGLAVFAEELGGRLVPDDRCLNNDCLTQFQLGNLGNAYSYLSDLGNTFLIGPRRPPLPLSQYGSAWLFVRWLADHFADDSTLGTDLTRALVQSTSTGAENIENASDAPFDQLIGEWQLANYLDDHPDFGALTEGTRFTYTSWRLRDVFASFHQQDPLTFPRAYPLEPEVFTGGDYVRDGVLRAGSGRHLLVEASSNTVDLLLTGPDGSDPLGAEVSPRTAVLRLR